MKSRTKKSVSSINSKSVPNQVGTALASGTGIALMSAAAVGVAGFFAWRNREAILSFVGKYVDLPESLQAMSKGSNEDSESWDEKGASNLTTVTPESYTKPTTEHRM